MRRNPSSALRTSSTNLTAREGDAASEPRLAGSARERSDGRALLERDLSEIARRFCRSDLTAKTSDDSGRVGAVPVIGLDGRNLWVGTASVFEDLLFDGG